MHNPYGFGARAYREQRGWEAYCEDARSAQTYDAIVTRLIEHLNLRPQNEQELRGVFKAMFNRLSDDTLHALGVELDVLREFGAKVEEPL